MIRVETAPAKINLGLEILGRRDDEYHEIRTVLCAISLSDDLTFEDADEDQIAVDGIPIDVPPHQNLIGRALAAMRERGAEIPPQRVTVDKRIPAAAGLGGASSDAAATIRAFSRETRAAGADMLTIAASLGSDVPFFLGGPIAIAAGRGDVLTPLPAAPDGWVVLATPNVAIPNKTGSMYGAVESDWWSDGSQVDAIARDLPALPSDAPFNVFERALLARFPEIEGIRTRMRDAGAPYVALTGAGPTFYTLVERVQLARDLAGRLAAEDLTVNVASLSGHARHS